MKDHTTMPVPVKDGYEKNRFREIVSAFRSLLGTRIYRDGNAMRILWHLALFSNENGQVETSFHGLESELDISYQTVRTSVKKLKECGEISVEPSTIGTVITVNRLNK